MTSGVGTVYIGIERGIFVYLRSNGRREYSGSREKILAEIQHDIGESEVYMRLLDNTKPLKEREFRLLTKKIHTSTPHWYYLFKGLSKKEETERAEESGKIKSIVGKYHERRGGVVASGESTWRLFHEALFEIMMELKLRYYLSYEQKT